MKKFIDVAKELNKVLGLAPAIPTEKITEKALIAKIKEASALIDPENDEISKTTIAVLKELGVWINVEAKPVPKIGKKTPAPVVDEDEEDEDDDEEEDEDEEEEDEDEDEEEDDDEDEEEEDEDEDEEEENSKPVKESTKPIKVATQPAKTGKKEKVKTLSGKGVISTITSLIEESGKKGISKEEILKALIISFPDRAETSMKATINVQVPGRISKEKFELQVTKDNKFFKK